MIDNFDEVPNEEVVGLTQTGAEVVKPIQPPKTSLDLGQYYNDRIPTEMVSSWESNAENQSNLKFQENVVKAKGSMLRTRQEMEQAGVEGQTQLALGQYMREQSAEKAGWTGGYMLDQARQGEYLKSTIQAQLYGQQELQKYGMESQLEAARLAYDLGKEQLALQYYNEAYQKALAEAQLFGYYVAPETRDMFNQYQAALTALAANPDDERALDVKTKVEDFYKNGQQLTEADIRKFSTATFEMNQYMEAKLEAALTLIDEDPSKFIVKDASGNYAVDANNRYVMLDFDDVNSDDLMTFLRSDNEAGSKTSDYAVKSYMRYLGQRTINGYFSTLKEGEGPTAQGFLSWVESNPSLVNEWFRSTIAEGNKEDFFTQVGDKITAVLTGANGSLSVTFDLKNNKLTVTGGTDGASGSGGGGTTPEDPNNPFSTTYNYKDTPEKVMDNYKTIYQDYWKVNGNKELTFDKMKSEYEYLYGVNYFKSAGDYAVRFEKDLNTYYKVVNGKYNLSMNNADYKAIDEMVQALTIIKQDGISDTRDIYRDLLTQGIKSKIGLDLTGKIQVHNEAPANASSTRNRGFKIKLSDLSDDQKTRLLSTIRTPSSEKDGYLIIYTQESFGDIDSASKKISVGKDSEAYAYRTILIYLLRGR